MIYPIVYLSYSDLEEIMMNKLEKKYFFQYAFALLIIVLMHTILLDKIPRGINVDEIGSAIDAYSLGHFGVDRWNKSWPVYLKNYGDGQNALYTYLLVPILLTCGTSIYAIKSVIVVSSIVMALFGAKTINLIYEDKKAELSFLYLYAVMPVFILMLRVGIESHLMMSVTAISFYYLIKAVKTEKTGCYLAFGISSGLILYTYAISYIVVPLFLLFSLIYMIIKKKISLKNFLATAIPFTLLGIPLAIEQMINLLDLPELKIGIFTFPKLIRYRTNEIMTTNFFIKLLKSIKNTILFDSLSYNSVPIFGNFYYISVPFIIIGIIFSAVCLKKSLSKDKEISLIAFPLFYWIAYTLFSGFMEDSAGYIQLSRMNGILASLIIFLFAGIKYTVGMIRKELTKKWFIRIICAVYAISFILFTGYYFTKYDDFAYPYKWLFFERYDAEIFEFLDDPKNGYTENEVFLPWNYNYYLWEIKEDPAVTNLDPNAIGDGGIASIGRYRFDSGVALNCEYVFYKWGYTKENINLFRNTLKFNEYETENFIVFLDPLHDISFFRNNNVIGTTKSGDVTILKSYMSVLEDGSVSFYGWISIPEDFGDSVAVFVNTEYGDLNANIVADTIDDGRTVCFAITLDYGAVSQCYTQIFRIEGYDENKNIINSVEADMTE